MPANKSKLAINRPNIKYDNSPICPILIFKKEIFKSPIAATKINKILNVFKKTQP